MGKPHHLPWSSPRVFALTVPLVLVASAAVSASATSVTAGPLRAQVVVSETAQLFHVVDQLSLWSPYSHRQYRAHFGELTDADQKLLEAYAAMRKKGGHGPLEEALYTEARVEVALAQAVKARRIGADDAALVAKTLEHFRARVRLVIEKRHEDVQSYAARVQALLSGAQEFLSAASTFFSVRGVEVPIYVVVSPAKGFGGGGFNGGRLVVEVGEGAAGSGPLLHELWHAFAEPKKQVLMDAAARTPGLDFETLSEGLAYAVSPGLWAMAPGDGDALYARVRADLQQRKSFLNEPYVRFNRLALAVRPLLVDSLRAGTLTLEDALPLVLAQFRGLHAVAEAQERTPRGFFVFGTGHRELTRALAESGHDVWARDLQPSQLASLAPRVRASDVMVLVLPSSDQSAVPAEFRALAGDTWPKVSKAMRNAASGRVRVQGEGAPVVIYWGMAPGTSADDILAETTLDSSREGGQ